MHIHRIDIRPARRHLLATVTITWPNGRTAEYAKWRKGGGWTNYDESIDCAACLERDLNKIIKEERARRAGR